MAHLKLYFQQIPFLSTPFNEFTRHRGGPGNDETKYKKKITERRVLFTNGRRSKLESIPIGGVNIGNGDGTGTLVANWQNTQSSAHAGTTDEVVLMWVDSETYDYNYAADRPTRGAGTGSFTFPLPIEGYRIITLFAIDPASGVVSTEESSMAVAPNGDLFTLPLAEPGG